MKINMQDFLSKKRILVIAPHADDEIIGCGGIMAKIKDLNGEVFVIVVSVGDLQHYIHNLKETKAETRIKEIEKALNYLKVDDWEIIYKEKEKYLRLDAIPRRDLIAYIERDCRLSIDKIKPSLVALPAPSSHQDHEAVFQACFTACRPHLPDKKWIPPVVLAYESPQTIWYYQNFKPNFYVDITNYLKIKIKAYTFHKSQIFPAPHPNSLENIKRLAKLRGSEIGTLAAEAFVGYRMVV